MPPRSADCLQPNIGVLTVEQALADYAAILLYFRANYNNAHVITFGGSYGGWQSAFAQLLPVCSCH